MNSKISIVVLLAIVCTASALVCTKSFCESVRCNNDLTKQVCEQSQNGVYKERGTMCGCCPACLVKLNEGDRCVGLLGRLRGVPPTTACAPGLTCDREADKCVKIE